MRIEALKDLLDRYWRTFRASWVIRKELTPIERTSSERAFLPAALELQDSPPHPAARMTIWSLILFISIAVIWACFGKIDIVASAPGKLVVSDRSKVIQPLEPGVVKAIYVQDGQLVKAGQLLIELDGTLTGADHDKNQSAWLDAKLDALRAKALLNSIVSKSLPKLEMDAELLNNQTDSAFIATKIAGIERLAVSEWQEYQVKLLTIDADSARKNAERAGVKEQVHKLRLTLPIMSQKEKDYKNLSEKNFVSKHDYMEKEQTRIEGEYDLAIQNKKLDELAEGLKSNQKQKESIEAEFLRSQSDSFSKAQEKTQELAQEVIKTRMKKYQTQLTSPVDGIVQQLVVHTIGGVVTAAQNLMVIVPLDETVEAEAMLENKDIGFVNKGQAAAIKIETFNYTKYGLIDGKVQSVSLDAIQDDKRGLVYSTRVKLSKNAMNVEGKQVRLTPGMAVTVEIKTGKRKIIEYFLSPLIQYTSESIRER